MEDLLWDVEEESEQTESEEEIEMINVEEDHEVSDEEILRQLLASMNTTNEKLQIFALYVYFVYYHLTQHQFGALIALLTSPIFQMNIPLNVKKVFTAVQQDLVNAKVNKSIHLKIIYSFRSYFLIFQ